eukprot:COSAG06_NODE_6475_length_2919_cov_114.983333_1_plen_267_part_10
MEDAGSLELAACVRAVVEGDQLTMYLTTGKKKHKRYFWVDEQSGDIMWDKRGKTLPPNKKERLTLVDDKAATVRDANWKHRDLALTIHTAGVTLIVVARDAHMKTRWIQGLTGVMRSVGEKHPLGSGGADGGGSALPLRGTRRGTQSRMGCCGSAPQRPANSTREQENEGTSEHVDTDDGQLERHASSVPGDQKTANSTREEEEEEEKEEEEGTPPVVAAAPEPEPPEPEPEPVDTDDGQLERHASSVPGDQKTANSTREEEEEEEE